MKNEKNETLNKKIDRREKKKKWQIRITSINYKMEKNYKGVSRNKKC